MYQFYLKIGKISEKVNIIFISPETSTSYFDVALNKRDADQGSVLYVWSISCKGSICLSVRKRFLRLNVIYQLKRMSNVFVDVNVGIKNHNFNIPLILDKCNIMIVMQKLKFMQEFIFAINVECLCSSLHAKRLMHNYARAKHAKTCFCSI